ncbi:MAG: CAP domain-containing protein [Bacteroidota bacterium]
MKISLLLLLFFGAIDSYAQTKLDSLIVIKVNEYRSQKGLGNLIWENCLKPLTNQHLNYMVTTRTVPLDHSQTQKTKFGRTFKDFNERVEYILKEEYIYVGEVCLAAQKEGLDLDSLAGKLVDIWKNSPSHNEGLLKSYVNGVYVVHKYANSLNTNVGTFHNDYVYCVLNTILK